MTSPLQLPNRRRGLSLAILLAGVLLVGCESMPNTGGSPGIPTPPPSGGSRLPTPPSTGGMPGLPQPPAPSSTRDSGSMGDADERRQAQGETADGESTDGESTDGESTDGESTDEAATANAETESGESAESVLADDAAITAEERRAILARRLDESLGEFDNTLGEEQRRTAAERDARTASAVSSSGRETDEYRGSDRSGDLRSERGRREGVVAGGATGSAGGADRGGGRDRGTVPGGGSGAPDRGIPSGEDDDIVARRLRRAAEQETDPELKEKLWQEYIEYKRNTQG